MKPYGCHDRKPYASYYLPTGALDIPQYRINHVMTRECQYRHTELGKVDAKCNGCTHKQTHKPTHKEDTE